VLDSRVPIARLSIVLSLAAGAALARAAMLRLQLGAMAAALVALQVATRFLGRAHRGLPLGILSAIRCERSVCLGYSSWRAPGLGWIAAMDRMNSGGSRRGRNLGKSGVNFHDPRGNRTRTPLNFHAFRL